MATLSKHGELGQIHRLTYKLAYCADGKILRNNGDGWKCWRKLKPGVDPAEHYENCRSSYEAKIRDNPAFAEWRRLVHGYGFGLRALIVMSVKQLMEDIDGMWSELNDYGAIYGYGDLVTVEDCRELVCAYKAALAEGNEKSGQNPVNFSPDASLIESTQT